MPDQAPPKDLGAMWEIALEGKPRSYRDVREVAFESARYLKYLHPNSLVVVRDLRSNETFPVLMGSR
jgi:hypothetical protein